MQQRLVLLGVVLIFGGETFCLLGPIRYERVVHFSCHAPLNAALCSYISVRSRTAPLGVDRNS